MAATPAAATAVETMAVTHKEFLMQLYTYCSLRLQRKSRFCGKFHPFSCHRMKKG